MTIEELATKTRGYGRQWIEGSNTAALITDKNKKVLATAHGACIYALSYARQKISHLNKRKARFVVFKMSPLRVAAGNAQKWTEIAEEIGLSPLPEIEIEGNSIIVLTYDLNNENFTKHNVFYTMCWFRFMCETSSTVKRTIEFVNLGANPLASFLFSSRFLSPTSGHVFLHGRDELDIGLIRNFDKLCKVESPNFKSWLFSKDFSYAMSYHSSGVKTLKKGRFIKPDTLLKPQITDVISSKSFEEAEEQVTKMEGAEK